jgi:hypothetical protein
MSKAKFKCTFERVFALMFMCVLVSILIFPAVARDIGVQVGDWAKYSIFFEYSSSNENLLPSNLTNYLKEATESDWNNVTVKDISAYSDVTLEVTTHLRNGTTFTDKYVLNLLTGEGTISLPILVVANLQQGDQLTDDPSAAVINKTVTKNYAGANREVNFVPVIDANVSWNIAQQQYVINGNGTIIYYYYDKKTGILCESEMYHKQVEALYDWFIHSDIKMTQTNLWAPEPFSGWQWLLVGSVIITVPVMLLFYSKTKKKKHRKIDRRLTRHR